MQLKRKRSKAFFTVILPVPEIKNNKIHSKKFLLDFLIDIGIKKPAS